MSFISDNDFNADRGAVTIPSTAPHKGDGIVQLLAKMLKAFTGGLPTPSPSVILAPTVKDVTSGTSIGADSSAVTFENIGTTACNVQGVSLAPGQRLVFVAPQGGKFGAFSHNATATAILRVTFIPCL